MAWTLDLLKRLSDLGIPFVVVDGVAAVAHGASQLTEDLGVCAPLEGNGAARIIQALEGADPRWRMRPDLPTITPNSPALAGARNLYIRCTLGQLDVLGDLPGIGSFEQVFQRAVEMDFGLIRCRVIDLDTLIESKRIAGRLKDRLAVQQLEKVRKLLRERNPDDPDKG
jgi:hypothetical protein